MTFLTSGFTRPERDGRPLLVLVTGAPGSGKSTLAVKLAEVIRTPVVSKDRLRQGTLWTLGSDDLTAAPPGPPLWYTVLETHLELGISVIGDMALFPGLSEGDVTERLSPLANLVAVHCQSTAALARFETRSRSDPVHAAHVDALMLEATRLCEETFEPHELECPTLVVDTTDGYEPTIEAIVEFISKSPT